MSPHNTTCLVCWSKDQQILAKDEVIRAKDAVIAAKDEAIAQKDAALKAERELRESLLKQIKSATSVSKKQSSNIKSASCKAQEEKDALTIYVRNVTKNITYDMLFKAFSAFGTIRMLNMLQPKACAFVEFSTLEAYQRALAATSVSVGDGYENVVAEKRVRRPQQTFARRPSRDNIKTAPSIPQNNLYISSNNSSNSSIGSVNQEGCDMKIRAGWLRREDEGCDLTTIY
ncbi:hypothetical protein BGZ46_006415 [Entomortierella lignicola]|nr:hypothetical protein BGZ46_006415 [Entomortierella lignicola]